MDKNDVAFYLLATAFTAKLCFFVIAIVEIVKLLNPSNILADFELFKVPYDFYITILLVICVMGILFDVVLLVLMLTRKFNIIKGFLIVNTCVTVLLCLVLLVFVVYFARSQPLDYHIEWESHFRAVKEEAARLQFSKKGDGATHSSMDPTAAALQPKEGLEQDDADAHPGIIDSGRFLSSLHSHKYRIDVIQHQLQCCGLHNWRDWISNYSGSGIENDPGMYTSRYLWWTNDSRQVVVPRSCCVAENDDRCTLWSNVSGSKVYEVHRAGYGCHEMLIRFSSKFTLFMVSMLIIFVLTSIPRNIWIYRITELNRRTARVLLCRDFAKMLRDEAEEIERQENKRLYEAEHASAAVLMNPSLEESTQPITDKTQPSQKSKSSAAKEGEDTKRLKAGKSARLVSIPKAYEHEPEQEVNINFDTMSNNSDGGWV